jgi:signal transduction histidine kinase
MHRLARRSEGLIERMMPRRGDVVAGTRQSQAGQEEAPARKKTKEISVDVERLLLESRGMLQILAGSDLVMDISLPEMHGVEAAIGEEALLRVLVNLTVNARDAMPEGGHLRVSAEKRPAALVLYVEDSGPGMPAELVAMLNSPHLAPSLAGKRWPGHQSREVGVNPRLRGLGLEIVRELVGQAAGRLHVSTLVGLGGAVGTRIEIILPLAGVAENSQSSGLNPTSSSTLQWISQGSVNTRPTQRGGQFATANATTHRGATC